MMAAHGRSYRRRGPTHTRMGVGIINHNSEPRKKVCGDAGDVAAGGGISRPAAGGRKALMRLSHKKRPAAAVRS